MDKRPPGIICIMDRIDFITSQLNTCSEWFKGHEDKRVVQTYDILKDAFQKVRILWLED